jgi:ribosomal protein L10
MALVSTQLQQQKYFMSFQKTNEKFVIKVGALGDQVMSIDEIAALARCQAVRSCFLNCSEQCKRL